MSGFRRRSPRDLERLTYEAQRAVNMLRIIAIKEFVNGRVPEANARNRQASDLQRALDGKQTGFDYAGGRGEWLHQQEGKDNGTEDTCLAAG